MTSIGVIDKIGNLGEGFGINLFTDAQFKENVQFTNKAVYIGQKIFAEVRWSVTTIKKLVNFYVSSCTIKSGAEEVKIIKNNCYSEALCVVQLQPDKIVDATSKFSFVSFALDPTQMSGKLHLFHNCFIHKLKGRKIFEYAEMFIKKLNYRLIYVAHGNRTRNTRNRTFDDPSLIWYGLVIPLIFLLT